MSTEIDYWGLRLGIRDAIHAHPDLAAIPVLIEPHAKPAPEQLPAVLVFLTERTTPSTEQRIAGGTRTDHRVVFSLWVLTYSLDAMEVAVRQRDQLMAKVEVALMQDRTLGGRISRGLSIEAGDILQADEEREDMMTFTTSIETRVAMVVHTTA